MKNPSLKRNIFFILILCFITSFSQNESYEDNREAVEMGFRITFTSDAAAFIIRAKENYELQLLMGPFKNLEDKKQEALSLADCIKCKLVKSKTTRFPLNYVFEEIQEKDVFVIVQKGLEYKLELYRSKK